MKALKKYLLMFLLAGLIPGIHSCHKDDPSGIPGPQVLTLPPKGEEVVAGGNSFGIDLFSLVARKEPGNMMLSPLSASVALSMLMNGCGGNTYDQVRDVLGFEGLTAGEINAAYRSLLTQLLSVDPEVRMALANAVWYRQQFNVRQPFLDTMDLVFDAHIEALDFSAPSALDVINGWASENTEGRIERVLDEIRPEAVMFLMNALYFKGTWTWQFDPALTGPGPFYLEDGATQEVSMMQSDIPARVHAGPGYKAIELSYGRQNFSMVIIVPDDSLSSFLQNFTAGQWDDLVGALDSQGEATETPVTIPGFKFEYERKLNDELIEMGMPDAFDPFVADLSGISDAGLYVDFVKQNTFIEVNEEGTEAAAVTTIGIYETSIPEPFTVDRPFIFAIRERTTRAILFIGKVSLPSR